MENIAEADRTLIKDKAKNYLKERFRRHFNFHYNENLSLKPRNLHYNKNNQHQNRKFSLCCKPYSTVR
ncbi:MAG: hypothetical protein ACFN4D_10130, partial [Cardiobacterium sp.]